MNRKLIKNFISYYILIALILVSILYINYKNTLENYLDDKTHKHYLEYKAIYNEQKKIANIIFNTDINTTRVLELFRHVHISSPQERHLLRAQLHAILKENYKKLKSYDLRQLHFHLPDNTSFLRLQKIEKYGDNLTNYRKTVSYVNKNKTFIDGFEKGRIYSGFRFVYPLSFKDEYIGSVEISFSPLALMNTIKETYNNNSHFLIKKSHEEEKGNFIKSAHKDFYYDTTTFDKFKPETFEEEEKDLSEKILQGEPFTIFVNKYNIVKTIIPIKNPVSDEVVAALCICEKNDFLENSFIRFLILSFFALLALAIIFYLFFSQKITNSKLIKVNEDLDRRISLEIKKNRRNDISLLKRSKMVSIAEMLNHIAHQWRQPLNVITTSASGLIIHKQMNSLDDKTFDLLTKAIEEQSSYLSSTIENFREFLEDNDDNRKKINLKNKIDEALNIVQESFEFENIKLIKEYDEKELFVNVNVGDFIQVVLNILNNAKDAITQNCDKNNRELTVSIKRRKDKALICVEDNAGGIPKEFEDKVFEPYFTTKHESVGTGISLYLCYKIITQQEKGKLYFKNTNYGARFYVELPLED